MKKTWLITLIFFLVILLLWFAVVHYGQKFIVRHQEHLKTSFPIAPDQGYPNYWSMNGETIMLLGGSVEDNLFQIINLEAQLDLLKSVGGNYVRNTMSARDSGNVWPFWQNADGIYDLNQWNEEYWRRFNNFLELCSEREIVVQIELWATFDFYREPWSRNPFNPKNNINYSAERVHLDEDIPSHPTWTQNDFFRSVPNQQSNLVLLGFQQKFIDKILSHSLNYGNVLYCMDNETSVTAEWGKYWSLYIKKVAAEKGKKIYTTEMWDPWDLNHAVHRETLDHPEIYDFADISQNNHNSGDKHWENAQQIIKRLQADSTIRPLNSVKVYGNDEGPHQTTDNGIESFVKNVLVGAASSRFHRPPTGQGLNEIAQHTIQSMQSYIQKSNFFHGVPANELLGDRDPGEAFCRAVEGVEYVVYFPVRGSISLILPEEIDKVSIEWLDILQSEWSEESEMEVSDRKVMINTPAKKHMLAFIKVI